MKIKLLDIDKFCEKCPEITSSKIYDRSKTDFHPEGLFSQRIFGPVKNYTCACGVYWGRSKAGMVCDKCKVKITDHSSRERNYAKISLPLPVVNPIMYYLVCKLGKFTLKYILHGLIRDVTVKGCYYDKAKKKFVLFKQDDPVPEGVAQYIGGEGAYKIVEEISKKLKDKNDDWKFVYDNLDKFFVHNTIVLPPAFRPTSKTKDVQKRDQINDYILTILNFSLTKRDELYDVTKKEKEISEINTKLLQEHVFQMYEYITEKLSKKDGIIRESILGTRNDFSGRAVITPDPDLQLDECKIPYVMALELYKLEIANVLLEKRTFRTFTSAISYIDRCISTENYELYDIARSVCENKYIILNRQPTLHRMGILAFRVLLNKEYVIHIPPMACEPFNADFDGDQMAIYRPLYKNTEDECKTKLSIERNLISPTTGDLIVGINQDIVLGVYLLTAGEGPLVEIGLTDDNKIINFNEIPAELVKSEKKKCPYKIVTTEGRLQFYKCLPEIYLISILKKQNSEFLNREIKKKDLIVILNDVARLYPNEIKDTLDKIKNLGFQETTKKGITVSLHNMNFRDSYEISKSILDNPKLTIQEKINMLKSPEVMDLVKKNFTYAKFIESGSRGSWDQARQIILTRGYVSNTKGEIIQEPIKNNYVNGLTRNEFFNSCYGTRKGLLDTALNTGVSGYLTRKTVYAASTLELDYNNEDCGTTDTLRVHVTDLKTARAIVGRYYLDSESGNFKLITLANYTSFIDKYVFLRSPIFCKTKKLCKMCYGKNYEFAKSRYVGIIASQALGEVGTQLVMRTFHTSGVAQVSTSNKNIGDQQEDIVSDLTKVRNILHANVVYPYDVMPIELYKIYNKHRNIQLVHFECIVSQMMWVDKVKWRLHENRHSVQPKIVSVLSIPQKESWILALAFQKPKEYIIEGLLSSGSDDSILEKIMTNQKL